MLVSGSRYRAGSPVTTHVLCLGRNGRFRDGTTGRRSQRQWSPSSRRNSSAHVACGSRPLSERMVRAVSSPLSAAPSAAGAVSASPSVLAGAPPRSVGILRALSVDAGSVVVE